MTRRIILRREDGEEMILILSAKSIDKIINALYPSHIKKDAKGYIGLVNFFFSENETPRSR